MSDDNNERTQGKSFSKKVWTAGGILALLVVLFLLFKSLFSVLLLSFAAVLMAVYIHGFAGLLRRYVDLPQTASVFVSVFLNLAILVGFFWFVGARLQQQVSVLTDSLPQRIEEAKTAIRQNPIGNKVLSYMNSSGSTKKTVDIARHFFSSGFGILSDVYIILLIGIFFIAEPGMYKRGIIHLLPAAAKEKGDELLSSIGTLLKKWLKGQIFGFFFIAVLTGIGLWITGMPLVLTLALIAGILNFVPNFGPIIALIPGVLIAFTMGSSTVVIVICIYTGIQILQSAVTQPLIQKKMISIPPALIIIGQVGMGILGGFWGVLLATPLVAIAIRIVNELYVNKQSYHKYEVHPDN